MTTKHAIVEALKAPTGAIPNGPDLPSVTRQVSHLTMPMATRPEVSAGHDDD
jgi:hypothetical protein